jgi:hypothetical protein
MATSTSTLHANCGPKLNFDYDYLGSLSPLVIVYLLAAGHQLRTLSLALDMPISILKDITVRVATDVVGELENDTFHEAILDMRDYFRQHANSADDIFTNFERIELAEAVAYLRALAGAILI